MCVLQVSSKLECVCVKNFQGTNLGGKSFGPLQLFRFPTIIIFPVFRDESKNLRNCPEKKNDNIG